MGYSNHLYLIDMDSLQDIMGSRDYSPPDEIEVIKDYVLRRYKSKCQVYLQRDKVVLRVKSSALANTLRLEQKRLVEACNIEKPLVVQIGY